MWESSYGIIVILVLILFVAWRAQHVKSDAESKPLPKLVDTAVLAELWGVPKTWLQHHTRSACKDPIPHIRLGKYVRFDLTSPLLAAWLNSRRTK